MYMALQQQALANYTAAASPPKIGANSISNLQANPDWSGSMRDPSSTCHALTAVSENDAWVSP